MNYAYLFTNGDKTAVTGRFDGSNVPTENGKLWRCLKRIDNPSDAPGFDPEAFARHGYQILPSTPLGKH